MVLTGKAQSSSGRTVVAVLRMGVTTARSESWKLIAAPLFRPARRNGATVFLNLEDLEPHKDQWRYLSSLGRMTRQAVKRAADRAGHVAVAADLIRLAAPFSSQIPPPAASVLLVWLGADIRVGQAELTPALMPDHGHQSDEPAVTHPDTNSEAKERPFRMATTSPTVLSLADHPAGLAAPACSFRAAWRISRCASPVARSSSWDACSSISSELSAPGSACRISSSLR
jgi:hypothetical protein